MLKGEKKKTVIGLDVGSDSIKVVEIEEDEKGAFTLLRAKRVLIDSKDPDGLSRALRKASWGVSLKGTVISIVTDPRSTFHKLIVPQVPRSELREAVPWELKDQFAMDMKEAEFDLDILQPVVEKGIKKYEVLVAVSPKETVREHLRLLQKVEVTPSRLVQGPVALESLFKKGGFAFGGTTAVLEMGHARSELSIYRKGSLQFSRVLPVSGGDFTKALLAPIRTDQNTLSLSPEDAERVKCEYGLCQDEALSLPDSPVRPSHILPLVRPVAERLASELERSLIFYQEKSGGEKVGHLLLFGGGAALKSLAPFLSEALGIEVAARSPFEKVSVKGSVEPVIQESPLAFTLALAAALSGEGGINLLPREVKEQRRWLFFRAALKGVSTALAVSLFFLYIGMRIELSNRNKKIGATRLVLSAVTPALEEARQKILLGDLLNREPYWEDFFKELSHILPDQAYLESLTVDQGKLSFKGMIVTGKEDAERLLSALLQTMEKGMFHNVSLVETEKLAEGKGSSFGIQAELDR